MKTILYISLLALGILFSSCEKEITYKGEAIDNFLVVNGVLSNDSLLQLNISRSTTIFEPDYDHFIQDANVSIYENGELVETLSVDTLYNIIYPTKENNLRGDRYYILTQDDSIQSPYELNLLGKKPGTYSSPTFKPQIGKNYTIKVEQKDFETVSASVNIPQKANAAIESIENKEITYTYTDPFISESSVTESYTQTNFKVKIKDPEGRNFYQLRLQIPYTPKIWDEEKQKYFTDPEAKEQLISVHQIISKDPVLNNNTIPDENEEYQPNPYLLFNDELFNGKDYTLAFFIQNNLKVEDFSKIKLDLVAISQELYLYLRSITASNESDFDIFSEPVEIQCNVQNGAGIIGASTSNVLTYNN